MSCFYRRTFAATLLGSVLFITVGGALLSEDRYAGLDTSAYLGAVRILATIEDDQVFTEGPAWGQGSLLFTNVPSDKILRWDGIKLTTYRANSNAANGLHFDHRGRLIACEGGATRVTRTNMRTGRIQVLASQHHGFPLAAPNDICFDYRQRIYFSSRPGTRDPATGNVNAVYRIDRNGKLTQVLRWPDIHMPNGLVTSPDGKTLYLIEAHPDEDHHRDIRAYDITARGALVHERVVINFYPGRSGDGMAIDSAGNLYVAAGLHATRDTSETLDTRPGIHVISPTGKLLAFRETPEDTITNCTFGGPNRKTLYVTCGTKLVSIATRIAGKD